MSKAALVTVILFLCNIAHGQYDREDIYPNLNGDQLRSAIIADYKVPI